LAGFWDGEGSIGLIKSKKTRILVCQLSNTDFSAIKEILSILENESVSGRGYTYQERDIKKHRDAHYIRVTGIANVRKFATLMLPYAVVKKRHWEIALEWANSRIAFAGGLDEKGHLRRGGIQVNKGYSQNENDLAEELTKLNSRGPEGRISRREGRVANEQIQISSL